MIIIELITITHFSSPTHLLRKNYPSNILERRQLLQACWPFPFNQFGLNSKRKVSVPHNCATSACVHKRPTTKIGIMIIIKLLANNTHSSSPTHLIRKNYRNNILERPQLFQACSPVRFSQIGFNSRSKASIPHKKMENTKGTIRDGGESRRRVMSIPSTLQTASKVIWQRLSSRKTTLRAVNAGLHAPREQAFCLLRSEMPHLVFYCYKICYLFRCIAFLMQ